MKPLEIQTFPFKDVFTLTIEYRMYLNFLQNLRYLGWFKTSQAARREENKVVLAKQAAVKPRAERVYNLVAREYRVGRAWS